MESCEVVIRNMNQQRIVISRAKVFDEGNLIPTNKD